MESGGEDTTERTVPKTLKEAYGLRDAAATPMEWDFYQQHVYRLRKEEYNRSWWKRVLGRWK